MIVNKWYLPNNAGCIVKAKNVIMHSYLAADQINDLGTTMYPYDDPVPIGFNKNGENDVKGAVLLVDTKGRLFHDFSDIFYKALYLKNLNQDFRVILVNMKQVGPDGYFVNMLGNDYEHMGEGFAQPFPYLKEFFDYFDIKFECMNLWDMLNKSFDYVYLFYSTPVYNKLGVQEKFPIYKALPVEFQHTGEEYLIPEELDLMPKYTLVQHSGKTSDYQDFGLKVLDNNFPRFDMIKNKKIFISRKSFKDRYLDNIEKLEEYFAKDGFEIVQMENYSFIEQIKLVQEASHVAILAGSSLVFTIFCNPDAKLLSLHPFFPYTHTPLERGWETFNVNHKMLYNSNAWGEEYQLPKYGILDLDLKPDVDSIISIIEKYRSNAIWDFFNESNYIPESNIATHTADILNKFKYYIDPEKYLEMLVDFDYMFTQNNMDFDKENFKNRACE